jgi:hypothetical protein
MTKRKRSLPKRDIYEDASASESSVSAQAGQKKVRWEGNTEKDRLEPEDADDEEEVGSQSSEKVMFPSSLVNYYPSRGVRSL